MKMLDPGVARVLIVDVDHNDRELGTFVAIHEKSSIQKRGNTCGHLLTLVNSVAAPTTVTTPIFQANRSSRLSGAADEGIYCCLLKVRCFRKNSQSR